MVEYGFVHIDGDEGMRSAQPDLQAKTKMLSEAFALTWGSQLAPLELWEPYYEDICRKVELAQATQVGCCVVVAFAVFTRYQRDWLRRRLGSGLKFVVLDCPAGVCVERVVSRKAFETSKNGKTLDEFL